MTDYSTLVQEKLKLAQEYSAAGQYDAALQVYQLATQLDKNCVQAFLEAGILLRDLGQLRSALQALRMALRIEPTLSAARQCLAGLLRHLVIEKYNPELDKDFVICYSEPDVDHQVLEKLVAQLIVFKYQLNETTCVDDQFLQPLIITMTSDDLWIGFLTKSINTHPLLEKYLTAVRRCLLIDLYKLPTIPPEQIALVAALGLQSFANEYVFNSSLEEQQIIEELANSVSVDKQHSGHQLLLLTMYGKLIEFSESAHALTYENPLVTELIKNTVSDLQEELTLREKIKSFAPEQDLISQKVRAQYEQHPYPRWRAPPPPTPISFTSILERLPGISTSSALSDKQEILIAGCGTGFESISIARMDQQMKITAVDLSRSSLAYAQRMANELSVENIEFIQGDILNIDLLGKKFDIVISTGVLHHMEDPEKGWCHLCKVTKPDGLMRISLYSEKARESILYARAAIACLELSADEDDIRTFRSSILSAPIDSPLALLRGSDDFYSMSGARDLLFHVQEHCFTLPRIAAMLNKLGLRFITMDALHPAVRQEYLNRYPQDKAFADLNNWHDFETQYPDTFVGMYHFWCEKISG